MHLNVVADAYLPEIEAALEPYVYEVVGTNFNIPSSHWDFTDTSGLASHRGSISAEHGIGAMKTHALSYSKSALSIDLMKRIKRLFDPNRIMNPGKVIE